MVPVPKKTMNHFTHPHPLLEINNDDIEFLCDGCKTPGTGTWYRCNACNFDLHDFCCTCPATFSSFMHPQHQLTLVVRKPDGTRRNERICDLCRDEVEGLFYRCKICDFDIHPLCTQLPEFLQHRTHPFHPLRLQAASASWCAFCHDLCTSWRYRCGICGVDMHIECVLVTLFSDIPPPISPPQPPPPPPQPFYGGTHPYQHQYPPPYFQYQHPNEGQSDGSKRKNNVGKKIGTFVGKLAIGVLSSAVGVPDISSLFS